MARKWLVTCFSLLALALIALAALVRFFDPFLHYHAPYAHLFRYVLDNERSQNIGLVRQLHYDAILTGSSMTENFRTSQLDALFGAKCIKVPFSGATFGEMRDIVLEAVSAQPELKLVFMGLDRRRLLDASDHRRTDMGVYPDYLYDRNPLTDVKYLFNKDVLVRILAMARTYRKNPGMTAFDDYASWGGRPGRPSRMAFGPKAVLKSLGFPVENRRVTAGPPLTDEQRARIEENIQCNVEPVLKTGRAVYLFFTPYSIMMSYEMMCGPKSEYGGYRSLLEAERLCLERVLRYPNVRFFAFDDSPELVGDLNHYKDIGHYGYWVNDWMLRMMKAGRYEVTPSTCERYLARREAMLKSFDYEKLKGQPDHDDDGQACRELP